MTALASAVALISGGMDSATLLWDLIDQGHSVYALAFDYGQQHRIELEYARNLCHEANDRTPFGVLFDVVDLTAVTHLLGGSALTDDEVEVPHGHYAAENMKITVVPNRNAIMLSIAWGAAVAMGASIVAAAMHAGDHTVYPDCRPVFTTALEDALQKGTEGFGHEGLVLYTPFIEISKQDIVTVGHALNVPYHQTWSCYEGGEKHCGKCGTCVERKEAFELAGVVDPTIYADSKEII